MARWQRRVRVSTNVWNDPEWRALAPSTQLFAFACLTIGASGANTNSRLIRYTGFDLQWVEGQRAVLSDSSYAWVLPGHVKRRKLPRALREIVFKRDAFTCLLCGTGERLTVDHVLAVSRGGSDDLSNLRTLCHSCNARKGARDA